MKAPGRSALIAAAALAAALAMRPVPSEGQSFVLDPTSSTLVGIGATSADVLVPVPPAPALGPLPAPAVGLSSVILGLLAGDVIDALSYIDDGAPGPPSTIYFSVDRASVGVPAFPPDVATESVFFVPPLTQGEAASDIFATNDPTCAGLGFHNQILDGNGLPLGPVACYPGFGLGLTELLALPGPPLNDNVQGFDWGEPGRGRLFCTMFSLAPGSPTLTPGTNPLLMVGAEPGDILVWCPGPPMFLAVAFPAVAMGLVSGGPGCAPPACDDVDALSAPAIIFSLSPASPSIGVISPADLVGPGPAVFLAAGALGLTPADNVNALEMVMNPCPVPAFADPDADAVGVCDNCPAVFNPGQEDTDGDGVGDRCDPCTDIDLDGFGNPGFSANLCPTDNCPFFPNPLQADADGDGIGDDCDTCTDTDGDGFGNPGFPANVCALDNCPTVANPLQTNSDGDADGDACDSCPHITGGVPGLMTVKKVLLGYGGSGPGGSDDKPKVIKAQFSTGAAFDPDSTDDVHVTLKNTGTGGTLFAATMAAGGFWTQPSPPKLKWKYLDTAATVGVKVAKLLEAPAASTNYKFKMIGKSTNIAGPLAGGFVEVTLEIENGGAGVCFQVVNSVCSSTPTKDVCF